MRKGFGFPGATLAVSRIFVPLVVCMAVAAAPLSPAAERASRKFDLIASGRAKPGSVVVFTPAELNAWTREYISANVTGVTEPEITLGEGTAAVSALVDFAKLRTGEGRATNPLLGKLLEGERHLRVRAGWESGAGRGTVHLMSVELGGTEISGGVLDLLVTVFLRPMFPDTRIHINEPFDLGNNLDRIEIRPRGVSAFINKQPR